MVVSNRNLLFQGSIFRGYVSFRQGTETTNPILHFSAFASEVPSLRGLHICDVVHDLLYICFWRIQSQTVPFKWASSKVTIRNAALKNQGKHDISRNSFKNLARILYYISNIHLILCLSEICSQRSSCNIWVSHLPIFTSSAAWRSVHQMVPGLVVYTVMPCNGSTCLDVSIGPRHNFFTLCLHHLLNICSSICKPELSWSDLRSGVGKTCLPKICLYEITQSFVGGPSLKRCFTVDLADFLGWFPPTVNQGFGSAPSSLNDRRCENAVEKPSKAICNEMTVPCSKRMTFAQNYWDFSHLHPFPRKMMTHIWILQNGVKRTYGKLVNSVFLCFSGSDVI